MDFQEFAATETSALLARSGGESAETSRQRVQAFRSAINAAIKALETALTTQPPIDVSELAGRLAKAATAESETAARRVAAEAKTVTESLQNRLDAEIKEKESLTAALAESRVQADELRLDLQNEKGRIEQAREELLSAREAQKALEAARAEAVTGIDREARARAAVENELNEARAAAESEKRKLRAAIEELRADADKLRAEIDKANADAERMAAEAARAAKTVEAMSAEKLRLEEAVNASNSQAQAAEAKLTAVTSLFKASATRVKALERGEQEHQGVVRDLEERLAAARGLVDEKVTTIRDLEGRLAATSSSEAAISDRGAAMIALFDNLLGGFQSLAGAKTIAEVTTVLVRELAAEFARVALFRVKANRLEGQEQIGFDSNTDIAKLVMPLGMDSLPTRAVSSGRIEHLAGTELADNNHAPFGGNATCALALPVVVNGETLAIVYADDSGQSDVTEATRDLRVRFADALLRHATAVLMRLTSELRAVAELRAYASSLLSELEEMYMSDVNAGKAGTELQNRLKDNLEYARSIYANRIALECPEAATLLDDQLSALVERQSGTAFGRDLALVAGVAAGASNDKAEAS
jgi:predicted  nucleic acid-binding Zn-ribbon protein